MATRSKSHIACQFWHTLAHMPHIEICQPRQLSQTREHNNFGAADKQEAVEKYQVVGVSATLDRYH